MGLDNGLTMRGQLPAREDLPNFLDPYTVENDYPRGEIEIAYWRKCYGLKSKVLDEILNVGTDEAYVVHVSSSDLRKIRDYLYTQMDKDNWGDSRFTWEEYLHNNANNIARISWALEWMKHHDVEIEFYDSY